MTRRGPAFLPKELHYTINDMQGGYSLGAGESLADGIVRMNDLHARFLDNAIRVNERALALKSDPQEKAMLQALTQKLKLAQAQFKANGMQYSSIRMRNRPGLIAQLMRERLVVGVTPAFDRPASQNQELAEDEKSTSHESWAPYSGDSDVTKTSTYSFFYFNSLAGFTSDGTYEQETQVYNVDFADYDGYWSSNLPSAYYDTPFADTIDNFTVGSAEATSIVLYTQYYTHMALRGGPAATATVRIKGQRGTRDPDWCYSTWCIFAAQTTSSMAVFTAPSNIIYWTY
jgi:hypothetical protein